MYLYDNIFVVNPDDINENYKLRYKLDNGDVVEMELYHGIGFNDCTWIVALFIGKRKKGFQYLQTTGRSGTVEGLRVAKFMLEDLITTCLNRGEKLLIFADDKRRWQVYKRYLMPLGFKLKFHGRLYYLEYEKI